MSKDKEITLFDDIEWGNKTLPGLSDEELMNTNWNIVTAARERSKNPEWIAKNKALAIRKSKDPKWLAKIRKVNRKNAKKPERRKKMLKKLKERVKDPNYLMKQSKAQKKVWQNEEYRNKMLERYNTPEYKEYIKKRNKKIAKRDHDKIVKRNQDLARNPKWLKANAKACANRSENNEEWIRKNCRPVSTPYGIFKKAKDAAIEYNKEYPNEKFTSVCIKLRSWYRSDKKPEWKYLTWEEYDNIISNNN